MENTWGRRVKFMAQAKAKMREIKDTIYAIWLFLQE